MRKLLAWLGKKEKRTAVYKHVNEDPRRIFNDARTKIVHFATAPIIKMRIIIISLIKCYQKFISVYWPNRCRFYPSCSEYTIQAIDKMGIIKGIWLGLKRIGRCHPFNQGGVDIIGGAQ